MSPRGPKRGQLAVHRERLVDELRQIARQAVGLGLSTDELHELLAEAASGVEQPTRSAANRGANVMNEPAIELQAVTKSFRPTEVLRGVTFAVERGKTFAFLGRNAAGKTTTIRMLLGLLKRDDGSIRVLGLDPRASRSSCAAASAIWPKTRRCTAGCRSRRSCGSSRRFIRRGTTTWRCKYVRDFELPLATKIKHLSKGQNVRLGLVLALAHRPELVILDDPALGLDPIMRKQFNRDLITHLQGEGRTVFYSSHLLYEVEPVADEVAILDQGRIVRQADTETLRRDVKQLILSREAFAAIAGNLTVLDERERRRADGRRRRAGGEGDRTSCDAKASSFASSI